jgi:hypothetical protein
MHILCWYDAVRHFCFQTTLKPNVSITGKFASLQEKRTYPPIINEDMHPPDGPPQQSPNHGPIPQSPRHDMGTVEEPPVESPVGPLFHSPNHEILIEEPSIDLPMGPHYRSPNYDMYTDEPTINPPVSPTQLHRIDFDEPPERLRCQPVTENIPALSPLMDLGWNTPNSSNNLLNSSPVSLPTLEPEELGNSSSIPAKRARPMSQGPLNPLTPHHERDIFRIPPIQMFADREVGTFLQQCNFGSIQAFVSLYC